MGYQALLFCPDEKTARTVTQVLSELDFSVTPCTEPFAAVKKLMGEHFDAVVVDCDNEQNATLLFKSARNAPNNQSALAVAVVEGQAGVAKAFRIGANLVLTKPINVEQAKGTLRVARGLLRKGDAAKPATAATPAPAKPTTAASTPARPVQPISSAATPRPAAVPPVSTQVPRPTPQPSLVASASSEITEAAESAHPAPKQVPAPSIAAFQAPVAPAAKIVPPVPHEPEPEVIFGKPEAAAAPSAAFSATTNAGSASAAAPAREVKPLVSTKEELPTTISEPEKPAEKTDASASSVPTVETVSPAPSFTFGGAVQSGEKSAGTGNRKILLAVASVALLAGVGYVAWTQWGHSMGSASPSPAVTTRPATGAPVVPQAVPNTAVRQPAAESSTASAPASSAKPSSTVAEATSEAAADSSPAEATPGKVNKQDHPSKANAGVGTAKPAASLAATNNPPATVTAAQPMVIKNGGSQPVAEKAAPASDAPAPSIAAIAPAGNGGPLPNLMGGANSGPAPVLQTVNVSQGVSQGLLIKKPAPSYPGNALRLRIEGSVQLLATISKTGDISAVKVLSGDPSLARAAADAVKQWKYKPYLLDGAPVEMQTQITVSFKLPR
jgi:TonB family protein